MKKKLLALLLLAGGLFTANAQNIRPRIEVGGVMSIVEFKASSVDLNSKVKMGYRVSGAAEIGLGVVCTLLRVLLLSLKEETMI